jgi:hypothetical protein
MGIIGMAQAHMAKGIKHAFMGKHPARQCELVADFSKMVGHGSLPAVIRKSG